MKPYSINIKSVCDIQKNRYSFIVFLIVYSFICKLFFSLASPVFCDECFQADNIIFNKIGKGILEGQVLYKDLLDNKTPYIFFLNTLANLFSFNHIGLYIIESLFMLMTLYGVYKLLKLFINNDVSVKVGTVLFSIFLNNNYMCRGMSKTECYTLPFIIIVTYVVYKHFNGALTKEENSLKKYQGKLQCEFAWQSFIIGILSAFSVMINIKSGFYFISIYLFVIIEFISRKKYKVAIINILFGFVGSFICILPYILYMVLTDSFRHMIFAVFEVSLNYIKVGSSLDSYSPNIFVSIINYVSHFGNFFIFSIISFIIVIIFEKNIWIKYSYCLSYIVSIFYISAANNMYSYYLVSMLIYILPIYIFIVKYFNKYFKVKYTQKKEFKLLILSIILALGISYFIGFKFNKNQYMTLNRYNENMKKCISKYYKNLDDKKVLSVGFVPEVYQALDVVPKFPCFIIMNNTYNGAPVFYSQQLKYINNGEPDIVVIRDEAVLENFPEPMQDEIKSSLNKNYRQVEDVDSMSNYGVYHIYIRGTFKEKSN